MLEDENFSDFLNELQKEWRAEVAASPEVKRAKLDLEYHTKKMRQLTEELHRAELYERELKEKVIMVEKRSQPPLMRFYEALDNPVSVGPALLEEIIHTRDVNKVVRVVRQRVVMAERKDRKHVLTLLRVTLRLRDGYLEAGIKDPLAPIQELAKRLLRQLGGSGLCWETMDQSEAQILLEILQEVENIPPFVRSLLQFFLTSDRLMSRLVVKEAGVQTAAV